MLLVKFCVTMLLQNLIPIYLQFDRCNSVIIKISAIVMAAFPSFMPVQYILTFF